MGIGGFIKKVGGAVGGFFKQVFTGMVKVFIEDFEEVAEQIVKLLMLANGKSGGEKLSMAIEVLKGYAAKSGKKYINQSGRLLVQLELTEAEGDDLERIIKEGLKPALKVIEEVNLRHLMDDSHRRTAAFNKLSNDLKATGKTWLLKPRRIHTLIELAVASLKAKAVKPKPKTVKAKPKAVN